MSLKKISKNQPEKFEFNQESLEASKKILSNYCNSTIGHSMPRVKITLQISNIMEISITQWMTH